MSKHVSHKRQVRPCAAVLAAAAAGVVALVAPGHAEPGLEPIPAVPAPSLNLVPSTPTFTVADRQRRLAEKGMTVGSPVMIRIFKGESELEMWLQKDGRFELFAVYPICFWSGRLGPKQREGDRQAPEGFYTVGTQQLHRQGRHPRSLDLGFPNALDRAYARTGSYILLHGGCKSIGCYAMTNPVMDEIYALSEQALRQGQERIQVHVFPFRMTEDNMNAFPDHPWRGFWLNLKIAYDAFEHSHVPPRIGICEKKYVVSEGDQPGDPAAPVPSAWNALTACERDEAEAALWQLPNATTAKARRIVVRSRIRRFAKRNARHAHVAARRARVTVQTDHVRTSDAGLGKSRH